MIGPQIRQLRKRRNMTLQQLAEKAGTSASALHRYETGWDRFAMATLQRIAKALGAHLDIRLIAEPPRTECKPTVTSLVTQLGPLFWDKQLTADDLAAHPAWVISRVLMFGNADQVRATRSFFGDELIRSAINRRGVDVRTRAYWELLLGENVASASTQ